MANGWVCRDVIFPIHSWTLPPLKRRDNSDPLLGVRPSLVSWSSRGLAGAGGGHAGGVQGRWVSKSRHPIRAPDHDPDTHNPTEDDLVRFLSNFALPGHRPTMSEQELVFQFCGGTLRPAVRYFSRRSLRCLTTCGCSLARLRDSAGSALRS